MEDIIAQFKRLPDWELYPMPEIMYKKYNFPIPQPSLELRDSLKRYMAPPAATYDTPIHLPPAPGGVRTMEVPELKPMEVKVEPQPLFQTLTSQIGGEHPLPTQTPSACSTESTETKSQEKTDRHTTSPPDSDAD